MRRAAGAEDETSAPRRCGPCWPRRRAWGCSWAWRWDGSWPRADWAAARPRADDPHAITPKESYDARCRVPGQRRRPPPDTSPYPSRERARASSCSRSGGASTTTSGRLRPLRRRGLLRAGARPLPRRDHRAARRGAAEDDGHVDGPGREGHARRGGLRRRAGRRTRARASARWASAWAAAWRCGPRRPTPRSTPSVTYYYVMPHGKPDFSKVDAPVLGHFGTADDFVSVDDAKALEKRDRRRHRARTSSSSSTRARATRSSTTRPPRHLRRGPRQEGVAGHGRLPEEDLKRN